MLQQFCVAYHKAISAFFSHTYYARVNVYWVMTITRRGFPVAGITPRDDSTVGESPTYDNHIRRYKYFKTCRLPYSGLDSYYHAKMN